MDNHSSNLSDFSTDKHLCYTVYYHIHDYFIIWLPFCYTCVHHQNGSQVTDYYIVVWEKLVVGNIHEKKFRGKKIHLNRLQTIKNYSISLW